MATTEVLFSVSLDSPIAVYVQIENQVQFAIASGKFAAGDHLPCVREMSEMLSVNPNTVTKAYRDLELMGLVYTRRGVGVMVTGEAPALCRDKGRQLVKEHLREAVAECLACGLNGADVRAVVSETMESHPSPYNG